MSGYPRIFLDCWSHEFPVRETWACMVSADVKLSVSFIKVVSDMQCHIGT